MRKITKLNNKGFTLIELLAVIVILAVVMAIAARSVIGVMNDSRKSSLKDSAASAASAFTNAYAEKTISNSTTVFGISFDEPKVVKFNTEHFTVFDELGISSRDYSAADSFVHFDGIKFVVCLVAPTGSNYYVANSSTYSDTGLKTFDTTPADISISGKMFACSNNENSWES